MTLRIPDQGGEFHAPRGQKEGLAMLLDGETVPRPGEVGGPAVNVYVQGSVISERELIGLVRDELNYGGLRGAIR